MTATGDLVVDQPDLVFLETIPEDAGLYYCKATNQVKKDGAKSTSARLKVYCKLSVVLCRYLIVIVVEWFLVSS